MNYNFEEINTDLIDWDQLNLETVNSIINPKNVQLQSLITTIQEIEAENSKFQSTESECMIASIKDNLQKQCHEIGSIQETIIGSHRLKLGCFLYNQLVDAELMGDQNLKNVISIYIDLLKEKTLHLEFLLNLYSKK
jgi:hypothetical protein